MSALPAPRPRPLSRPWLLADVGGTHARFGWLGTDGLGVAEVRTLVTADHPTPAAAARAYLADLATRLGPRDSVPHAAAFAVATAVAGDEVALTNSGWSFSVCALQRELGLQRLVVLNDFEALALSLPRLGTAKVQPIGPALAGPPLAARAVIGPGTGLGVAGLVAGDAGRWIAVPGEGGHATLAAGDDFEAALLCAVRREYAHVSAERLLSGIGLPVLYGAVAQVEGAPHPGMPPAAPAIVAACLDGSDALAVRTVDVFCALLGGFAGNVALTFGARGGVYVGGGIVPRLGERFLTSKFRGRFEAKGRFASYLQAIPTWLVTDTLAALDGAACALDQADG
ncbi:MAG: glucokinase [Pseudomonadota bacterium]|jgi:glucokinase|nr:glucokinase [Rubrivivax sp.]MCE2910520.1 glucokinase [Rubrivivax sp.]MCZ8029233.1 glucokinase [Rubrivivax sp.]